MTEPLPQSELQQIWNHYGSEPINVYPHPNHEGRDYWASYVADRREAMARTLGNGWQRSSRPVARASRPRGQGQAYITR